MNDMKKIILKLFIPIPFIRISQPGTIDTSFNPGDLGFNNGAGANNVVWTTALQPDGKINIGG
jgi:hypothetical protein